MTAHIRGWAASAALTAAFLAGCADLTAGLTPPAQATPEPGAVASLDRLSPGVCNPVLARSLAGARIPIDDVRDVVYGLYRDDRRGKIVGYDAWVYLKDQPGSVIVQMDEYCTLRQIYTRDGAKLPNRQA
ncbi:hypothetical protein [Azospirillum rugosum]|uniref:Lipoprotein n=1 Tax=Azospirillum rugosum TaxID=416170 RepID=A0ABS4SHP7_9PROT|nr:hypothetical protein [Azospirillum rugosum]MBP2291563.1 hypothetical protein [Azospirillum rugosum]MDQ0524625.1 hypothetical protein [Azospirillum rugosum]